MLNWIHNFKVSLHHLSDFRLPFSALQSVTMTYIRKDLFAQRARRNRKPLGAGKVFMIQISNSFGRVL